MYEPLTIHMLAAGWPPTQHTSESEYVTTVSLCSNTN